MGERYDYIIVGAGSAGCVLAHRLSEDPAVSVLVLEAGGSERSLWLDMPAAFAFAKDTARFDWGYASQPEPGLNGRIMPCPRGRVLGGSSSINAMGFVRGQRGDFDGWAARGLPAWSYAHCLPYFRRLESFSGGASAYRGGEGPLKVTAPRARHPLYRRFLQACVEAGYPLNDDTNAEDQEGFGPMDQSIADGYRWSTARGYLRPAMGRPNLVVRTGVRVTQVTVEGGRASGVVAVQGTDPTVRISGGEVILCAGAIDSPRLLMLSGIGPADDLRRLGIEVHAALPGVGGNLQDHVDASIRQACARPVSETPMLRPHRKALIGLQWLLTRGGPGATNHFEVAGYIRTDAGLGRPDVQLCFIPLLVNYDGSAAARGHGFQITVMPLHPTSRGRVSLVSADPAAAPRLVFNYLSEPAELAGLVAGLEAARDIVAADAMSELRADELAPGDGCRTATALADYVRATAKSNHHPCGTCRMGQGPDAVVDADGRVHGAAGLRVVDASIMPTIPSGNINAPTIMLAEKLADSILGRLPEPPAADSLLAG